VPLKKLQEKKNLPQPSFRPAALGDGEQLESNSTEPDYMRLALTSRVYDMVVESPMQHCSGLSQRLGACVHIKREDLLPGFSYRIRGAYNLLDSLRRDGVKSVVTFSIGSQGHSLAIAAQRLGLDPPVIVMPERTPAVRIEAIKRVGAKVHVYGQTLLEAQEEAERLAKESGGKLTFVAPHDDPRVIAGQATAGLEVTRQIGAAVEAAGGSISDHLDAIFVCTGGSSLIAGIAASVKQIMPHTKVIGVEPENNNLLQRSLLEGHRVVLPEPSHFVDGAAMQQLGPEVFRLCNELVDDIVTVSDDEICAAVRDCFEDTRAMLEPAGAISVAGLKKWLASRHKAPEGQSNGNYVVISSDASNIEFDILRFIAERASMGEHKERLFVLESPEKSGAFFRMYQAVQPRAVTEFIYRFCPTDEKALVYMCVLQADATLTPEQETQGVVDALKAIDVKATDVTANEMAKTHARYLAGGRHGGVAGERVLRFEFPETGSGALRKFLTALGQEWFVTLLHYRNHGGQVGKVLAGIKVPEGKEQAFDSMLNDLGYTFHDETSNPIFVEYMR